MKHMGFTLFSLGIIVAILGGAKVPAEQGGWPDSWWIFAIGATLGVLGLIVWHKESKAAAQASMEASSSSGGDPVSILNGLKAPLTELNQDIGSIDKEALTERVDELLTSHVLPFAEVRQQLVDRLGMEKGAEVLVTVAFAERLLNRVWTAAADGHLGEARACFPEAYDAFHEAFAMVSAAQ